MTAIDPLRNNGKPWSDDDRALLAKIYPDESNPTLARIFGRSESSIANEARKQELQKSAAYMATQPGCFKPGQEAWNKGMKGLDIGGKATRFKKGSKPQTWQPIGHERECDGYLQRKVTDTGYTPRDYRPVHHLVWEEHTGEPVPEGHALVFRDGNRRNFAPENLELVTRGELMRRNSYHTNLPPELARIVQLRGVLTRKINSRRRQA
ncbi:MAG: HNH endonuclease signature motif containing protein [Pseudomonadota bacterium]